MAEEARKLLKDKKRIVIKVGSSTITHPETGAANLEKIEKLVRQICDLKGCGKDVVLVSSGAIAVGHQALGLNAAANRLEEKQAFAAVGQARLMMIYQRIFSEYNITAAQILMTKSTMIDESARYNAQNTFEELLKLSVVPIVNENDTISTYEIRFGDNDRLSAIVSALIGADLLILLSDIDGLYSDDPHSNKEAKLIHHVERITMDLLSMGKNTSSSSLGTGGMHAKLEAAKIASSSGTDMIIANGKDMNIISRIMSGKDTGTLFTAHEDFDFDLNKYMHEAE